ncbi:acetyl-CoA C-acyltransferase [Microbacterium marinilacus]|uniref:Probable acetyl-CoA acetyltransferase n=1 Tax=Microbacterium marinilacus TaxID=415209 RepID=A0ABP7BPY9_9MICO|nr:acetyl-CoA C-acyltransferase [Microbacterium marinilacus]MBY0690419.1 acetyl-CoA C-acyltransferase [Microbacterium marinilacus]
MSGARTAVVAGYARTPFTRYTGSLADIPATALGAHAAASALDRAGVAADAVELVYGGQVVQAGAGQNPARQAAHGAGVPLTTPALTLNAVCLSGMLAVIEGARLIESGAADVVLAIGQESMSRAPHVWPGSRAGARYGSIELLDTLEVDGLSDAFEHRSMGASTEAAGRDLGLTRAEQDEWAAASHRRLAASRDFQAGEIAPFEVARRSGPLVIADDDGLRPDTTTESLGRLRPAFASDGTITAGNSSQVTDGAAALVLVAEGHELARAPIARIVSHAFVAGPDVSLHAQPANAIAAAAERGGVSLAELAAIEINEAFAAVSVHSARQLGVDPEIVNPHGGAIALGHPIGASGARIVGTLARQLAERGPGARGAAGICGGGGQGSAVVLEAL